MPLEIKGVYNASKGVFEVEADTICTKTYDYAQYILHYIARQLTEKERNEIVGMAKNDLFSFVLREDAEQCILDVLSRMRVDESDNKEANLKKAQRLAKKICGDISRLSNAEETTKTLMRYKVPIDRVESIIQKNITLDQIKKNSYLVLQKYGVDFHSVELFSFNQTPVREYSPARLRGAVYEALQKMKRSGNTFCILRQLVSSANYVLSHGVYHTQVNRALVHYCITAMDGYCGYQEVNGKQAIYLNHVWEEETIALQHLKRLEAGKKIFPTEYRMEMVEKDIGISYNAGQREAFKLLETSGVKILTGPPGSGKTAVIKGLIQYFQKNNPEGKVQLAATTGRAAKVMQNACGLSSQTVHKMLNVIPYGDSARGRDLNNPVDADLIIVDEVSMLGLQLFSILLQAIKSGSILLLVGDEDQLQSVEYGDILHDLIHSGCIETCRLTEVVRQSGSICLNAQTIIGGGTDLVLDNQFQIIACNDEKDLYHQLQANYTSESSQILCPIRHGRESIDYLNYVFADKTNPIITQYGSNAYRIGSKVIMNKTEYSKGYVNGDIGYIIDVTINNDLVVEFDDRTLILTKHDIPNMSLATAITIHKSQGSECDYVHVVLSRDACHMVTRKLIYTAITRARKKVIIYDVGNMLIGALSNTKERRRQTAFDIRCKKELNAPNPN